MILRDILRPHSLAGFLYNGVKSSCLVHIPGDPDRFSNLINDKAIDDYLEEIPEKSTLRNRSGELSYIDMVDCLVDGEKVEKWSKEEVLEHFNSGGATVVKDFGKGRSAPSELTKLLSDIDRIFQSNCSLWCNIYMTKEKTALGAHIDQDSIIVMQYKGSKSWDFFGKVLDWKTSKPVGKLIMKQGDFLYFSKWVPHKVDTIPGIETGQITMEIPTNLDHNAIYPDNWEDGII
jgi:hypothetical protein